MFSTKSIFAATAAFSLISSSAATYDASSKSNVALYWGQGANQQDLRVFCDESSVDVIPIAFINVFPDQGNGLIGENFGNKCWGSQPPGNAASYYQGPGNNPSENQLPYQCPTVQEDIPYCQAKGKKILLSLGGASATYALTGVDEGIALADFLWGAYGPLTPEWTAAGGIRPLDRSASNVSTSAEYQIDIDGFDFDIEYASADAQAGYIACIDRLRENFQQNPSKEYIISGAPQCPLLASNGFEDANMGNMILASQFDIIWIQFYNNDQAGCTARNWANANPNYPAQQSSVTTLNYQAWKNTINSGASNGAKIYLGLLAGPVTDCTPAGYGDFLNATEADHLISAFQGDDQFGGVMLWEATSALNDCECGIPYFDTIKNSLNDISPPNDCSTVTSSTTSMISSSSSSTSAPVSTTSSVVTSSSSSSVPASTTSSSSSSSSVPVSTSSSSSSAVSSSSSVVSSSSISPTSTPTPTTVPSVGSCVYIGCYSEATNSRALVPGVLVDYDSMSVEKCADYCKDYTMFGVEYGGECYCGNSLQPGSVLEPPGDCNQVCDGTPTEICGAGNRLDVYSCAGSSTSSSVSSTQSSSSSVSTTSSVSSTVSTTSSASSSSSSVISSSSSSSSSVVTSSSISSIAPTTSSSSSVVMTSSSSSSVIVSTTSSSVSTESSTSSSVPTLSSTSSVVPVSNTSSSVVQSTSSSAVVPTTSSSSVVVPTSSSSILTTSSSSSSTFQTLPPYTNSTRTATPTSSSSVQTTSSVVSSSSTGSVEPPTTSSTGSVTPTGSATDSGVSTSSIVSPSGTSTTGGVSSSIVSPSGTATDSGVPTSTEVPWTTSTVYTTSVYTITSCAPTVTNCPARIGSVTTEVISLYTTVCPVTQTQGNGGSPAGPTGTPAPPSPPSQPTEVTKYTTSTVYTTNIYTITSCAPTVTNCPAKLGSVTTEIVSLYTTVCPVANQTPGSSPSAPAGPKSSAPAVSPSSPAGGKGPGPSGTTTTHVKQTKTTYVTVAFATSTGTIPSAPQSSNSGVVSAPQSSASNSGVVSVVPSTMTVIPLPPTTAAPYPTGPSSKGKHRGTGTGIGLPSVSVVYTKQVEVSPVPVSVVKGQQSAVSTPASVPSVKATPVPSQFQGAAGRVGGSFSIVCAIALGAVALLL